MKCKKIDGIFSIQVANNLETRLSAYQLVYKSYLKKGLINKRTQHKLWVSEFNALATTMTLLIKKNKRIIGTITLILDSPIGLPTDSIYKQENDKLRHSKMKLAELSSLALDASKNHEALFLMARFLNYAYLIALYGLSGKKATDFVISVNPRYENFYKRFFLFEKIGGFRYYGWVNNAPAILLKLDVETIQNHMPLKNAPQGTGPDHSPLLYKYFHKKQEEEEFVHFLKESHKPWSKEEFRYFLKGKADILENTTLDKKQSLKKFIPEYLWKPLLTAN
ncbi:MAG: hypothetical protein JSV88_17845 [Candidatus Aminicenantes bacterium]|nr:MAG: hypothetical protein JSV88_17845 [Candidatus Aminicenantes bacterium]